MATKRTSITLNDTDQQALRALQARYKLATPTEALRFALRAFDMSTAQRTDATAGQELKALRQANSKLQQFADKAMHDFRSPFAVVATMLELLRRHVEEQEDSEAEKFLDFALKGVQQMRTVLRELQLSTRAVAQETPED